MNAKWITPSVTAFDEQSHIDIEANKKIYDYLIDGGMDGILILGSIGEFFAIPIEEKKQLIETAIQHINKRVTLYVGTNCMVLDDCIELSNYAIEKGADGVMIISPYYFNLPKASIINFYSQIAQNVKGNIFLYNFPERTGYDLSAEIVLELAHKYPNIIGIKDTVSTMGHTRSLIQAIKKELPDFLIYSGFDEFFGHNILSGGDGCIAGLSNFAPKVASSYARAVRENDLEKMQKCQSQIDSLMKIYDIGQQFIPIIKEAIIQMGVNIKPYCAKPMLTATQEEASQIHTLLSKLNLI